MLLEHAFSKLMQLCIVFNFIVKNDTFISVPWKQLDTKSTTYNIYGNQDCCHRTAWRAPFLFLFFTKFPLTMFWSKPKYSQGHPLFRSWFQFSVSSEIFVATIWSGLTLQLIRPEFGMWNYAALVTLLFVWRGHKILKKNLLMCQRT